MGNGGSQLPVDAAPDTPPPDGTACFGTRLVQLCLDAAPTQAFTVDAATTLNTDSSPLCAHLQSGPNVCAVAATAITINARLRATGNRPLVLLATTTITLPGVIDVGSHRGDAELGAGANSALCSAGTPPGINGGGAGGSFTGAGGNGGSPNPGSPGTASVTVTALRGGCAGQDGGGNNKGAKGAGGGAVYLIAGTSITIASAGAINATGAGGGGGANNMTGGGGGGGSGGMIGFDAPTVAISGLLLASGGGGGEGSVTNQNGHPGADPLTIAPAAGGAGGASGGGSGGAGSAITIASPGSPGTNAPNSGGGGGGGAGVIKFPANTTLNGAELSPLATPDP